MFFYFALFVGVCFGISRFGYSFSFLVVVDDSKCAKPNELIIFL